MSYLTGAQAVIASLKAHGIDTIFGIPGVDTLPLYDAIHDEPNLRHILARHEQGAGFMADGYARSSGRIGVVCTITGPGVTNVSTPVANAYADSIPLLVISASPPVTSKGFMRGGFHELKNQFDVMEALAGWIRSVEYVEEIPEVLYDAIYSLRKGRPQGAYVQIPFDLLELEADIDIPVPETIRPTHPFKEDIIDAARLLCEAYHPLIIAGTGVTAAGANEQLARLSELLGAPVLLGSESHDVLSSDHPLVLTPTGYVIPSELHSLLKESDIILVVGSKLSFERTDYGRLPFPEVLIQIDIDPTEIGRSYSPTVGIVADARLSLDALLNTLENVSINRTSRESEVAIVRNALSRQIHKVFGESIVMLDVLNEELPRNRVVVADMTMLGYASAQYLSVYEPRTYMHPSKLRAIGCALPMALGAKVAVPGSPVFALCGDGGFLLNMGELATAVQEKINIVAIVFNDSTYTTVKSKQRKYFNSRYIATDLLSPDFVTLARAFGIKGMRVQTPDELRIAVRSAIHSAGPTLIEVCLPPSQW